MEAYMVSEVEESKKIRDQLDSEKSELQKRFLMVKEQLNEKDKAKVENMLAITDKRLSKAISVTNRTSSVFINRKSLKKNPLIGDTLQKKILPHFEEATTTAANLLDSSVVSSSSEEDGAKIKVEELEFAR